MVTGNGGAKLYRKGTSPIMRTVVVEHGWVFIDVNNDMLTAVMTQMKMANGRTSQYRQTGPRPAARAGPSRSCFPNSTPLKIPGRDFAKIKDFSEVDGKHHRPAREWEYLAGKHPENDAWQKVDYITELEWKNGLAGFRFGDER